jgi:hypothetical protein
MEGDIQQIFTDKVLVPALKFAAPSWASNRFPMSSTHCMEVSRLPNGRINNQGVYLENRFLAPLTVEIRRIVNESGDQELYRFRDFFFLSHGYGLKTEVADLGGFQEAFDLDFDMNMVLGSPSLFVDFGMEQSFAIPGSGSATTALWKTVNSDNAFKHQRLLQSLFYQDEAGDLPIYKSYYRLDPFMQFSSFGGFDYSPPCSANVRSFGLTSVKAYPTFKHQHYHRQASGSEHTKSLAAIDLLHLGDKASTFTVSIEKKSIIRLGSKIFLFL